MDIKAESDGVWRFWLKGGQIITIETLPAGAFYIYEVTETPVEGFYVDATSTSDTKDDSGRPYIVKGTVLHAEITDPMLETVTFTNTKLM